MLKYSMQSLKDGYKLTVWEPAPITINRVRPFLFKFMCCVASEEEALEILSKVQACRVVRYQPQVVECALPLVDEQTVNTATA